MTAFSVNLLFLSATTAALFHRKYQAREHHANFKQHASYSKVWYMLVIMYNVLAVETRRDLSTSCKVGILLFEWHRAFQTTHLKTIAVMLTYVQNIATTPHSPTTNIFVCLYGVRVCYVYCWKCLVVSLGMSTRLTFSSWRKRYPSSRVPVLIVFKSLVEFLIKHTNTLISCPGSAQRNAIAIKNEYSLQKSASFATGCNV